MALVAMREFQLTMGSCTQVCYNAGRVATKDVIEHELAYEHGPIFAVIIVDGAVFLLDSELNVGWALDAPH
jgi:hypothetical protein